MDESLSNRSVLFRYCRIAAVLVVLFSSFSVHAQKFIGTRLEHLPADYNLSLLEVEVVAESEDWVSFEQLVPNLGMGEGVEWMRLTLDPMTENGKLIEIQNAGIAVESDESAVLFEPGVDLKEVVSAVNAAGASTSSLIAILEALKTAGSLHADLMVM